MSYTLNPFTGKLESVSALTSSSSASFDFFQVSPDTTWTINHNLGFKPTVSLYTTGGLVFEAEIIHTSINQSVVYLSSPTNGYARLN